MILCPSFLLEEGTEKLDFTTGFRSSDFRECIFFTYIHTDEYSVPHNPIVKK